MDKVLALADCNNFFVSCEILRNPGLKGKPVCVLSNCDGCVVSRSKEAKDMGIPMGMPYFMAKEKFPSAIYLSSDLKTYHSISKRVFAVVKSFASEVEICSIDEAFLDVTNLHKYYGVNDYSELAKLLRNKIMEEVGIPVSIGIANSKVLCKIATHKAKKDKFYYYIEKGKIEEEISGFKIEDIWSIGKSTVSLLHCYGIFTAGDILKKDKEFFEHYMGKKGLELKFGLTGENTLPVKSEEAEPKSIQKTSSFTNFNNNKEFLKTELLGHLHRACQKMRLYKTLASEVVVMLRTKNFLTAYKSIELEEPTNSEILLGRDVIKLFEQIYSRNCLYRSTGIFITKLLPEDNRQLKLINNTEKFEKISKILDKIEGKHGEKTVSIGVS